MSWNVGKQAQVEGRETNRQVVLDYEGYDNALNTQSCSEKVNEEYYQISKSEVSIH